MIDSYTRGKSHQREHASVLQILCPISLPAHHTTRPSPPPDPLSWERWNGRWSRWTFWHPEDENVYSREVAPVCCDTCTCPRTVPKSALKSLKLAYLCADMHINVWSRIYVYPHVSTCTLCTQTQQAQQNTLSTSQQRLMIQLTKVL